MNLPISHYSIGDFVPKGKKKAKEVHLLLYIKNNPVPISMRFKSKWTLTDLILELDSARTRVFGTKTEKETETTTRPDIMENMQWFACGDFTINLSSVEYFFVSTNHDTEESTLTASINGIPIAIMGGTRSECIALQNRILKSHEIDIPA